MDETQTQVIMKQRGDIHSAFRGHQEQATKLAFVQ